MLPNFYCIGAQKAGTTWLDMMLREHPEVWLPPKKEIHYYDCVWFEEHQKWDRKATQKVLGRLIKSEVGKADVDYTKIRYLSGLIAGQDYSFDWYASWFQSTGIDGFSRVGDITPEYCMIPQQGIDFLFSKTPQARIIYLVRDPLDRAWSQVKMRVKRRQLNESEIDWSMLLNNKDIIARGDYKEYIPKWTSAAGENNILFIPFGKIKVDPESVMHQVEDFLELSHINYAGLKQVVHKNKLELTKPVEELRILKGRLDEQYQFLSEYFSSEFMSYLK